MNDTQKAIEAEVKDALATEKSLQDLETELMHNKQFRQFIELSKTLPKRLEETWERIKDQMVEHNIKSIKGDWGTVTVAERINWNYDPTILPEEYFKKVVDVAKLTKTYQLEGEAPEGAVPKYTKYLVKRIK